jgi:hypothetical protein
MIIVLTWKIRTKPGSAMDYITLRLANRFVGGQFQILPEPTDKTPYYRGFYIDDNNKKVLAAWPSQEIAMECVENFNDFLGLYNGPKIVVNIRRDRIAKFLQEKRILVK